MPESKDRIQARVVGTLMFRLSPHVGAPELCQMGGHDLDYADDLECTQADVERLEKPSMTFSSLPPSPV
jgi:hypothetical protein